MQTHGTWGRRVVTWQDDSKLVAILYLNPKKRCSWHKHAHSYNQFFVISGELVVKTDIGPDNQRNYTKITAGQNFCVGPGVYHEFRTGDKEAIIEEIAYVKYDASDICRNELGGDCDTAIPKQDFDYHGVCKICGSKFIRKHPGEVVCACAERV
jgi:mannose-6-phosphate isomerase-like protein (cupin superfamily)